ncbi:MAG: hypothetical protein PVI26_13420 [Chitinispirillia bacterium]|jgi:hypothetical protein
MDSFKVVYEYSNHVEADTAKGILTSYGIKAYIHSDDRGGIAGGQAYITGVQQVKVADIFEETAHQEKEHTKHIFKLYSFFSNKTIFIKYERRIVCRMKKRQDVHDRPAGRLAKKTVFHN